MLQLFYGNAVTGNQRFPRPRLEAELIRTLEHSGGVKMFQLRRIGKSTFTLFAQEEMERLGHRVVAIDAQGIRSLDQLLFAVFSNLPRQDGLVGRLTSWASGCDALPQLLREAVTAALAGAVHHGRDVSTGVIDYWPAISTQVVRALRQNEAKLLLTIDELPYMLKNVLEDNVQGAHQANMLLASLREWRGAGMKMILAGSIGITALARKHHFGSEHLNDLTTFQIPPLTETEARAFVHAAFSSEEGSAWTDKHTQALLDETIVLYPSFLVKGLLGIGVKSPPAVDEFPGLFAQRIRPDLHDSFLNQLNARFRLYRELDGGVQRALILPILRQAVKAGVAGCPQSSIKPPDTFDHIDVQEALSLLQEDGFLSYYESRGGDRHWCVASRLVELWWQRAGLQS